MVATAAEIETAELSFAHELAPLRRGFSLGFDQSGPTRCVQDAMFDAAQLTVNIRSAQ
jgi:hypothetical protein